MVRPHSSSTPPDRDWMLVDISEFILIGGPPSAPHGPPGSLQRPDVALVGLGESSDHALGLTEKIVQEAACPVIVLIHARDPEFVKEASKRGVFAHIGDDDVEDWQSSIDIVLRRFAGEQRAILMERHSIDDASAFEMLREHSRTANRKLVDIATAVVDGHRLLPKQPSVSS